MLSWLTRLTGMLVATCAIPLFVLIALTHEPHPFSLTYSHEDTTLNSIDVGCVDFITLCIGHDRMLLPSAPLSQWSPDGTVMAAYVADYWRLYPADCLEVGGCTSTIFAPQTEIFSRRLGWKPDGSALAYTENEGTTLHIRWNDCWDANTHGCTRLTIPLDAGNIHTVDWSADGRWLALGAVQPHPDLYILDTGCFAAPETCPDHLTRLSEGNAIQREFGIWPSISADGSRLVYAYASARLGPSQVYMLDWQNHQREQLTNFANGAEVPAWSPDERYVAFAGRDLAGRNIYILDIDRRLSVPITRSGGVDSPAWRTHS